MKKEMASLYAPYTMNKRIVPNRFVAQAMEINCAEPGGAVSSGIIKRYGELAEGGWGIVFMEATSITANHLARKNGLVLNRENLDGFKRLVEEFKTNNEKSLLIIQLTHSGRQSGDFSQKVKVYEDEQGEIPVLKKSELDEIHEQFLSAIHLAKEAGIDGVDVKACHGYLGGELLRPLNNRNDEYGGSVENRARFISGIIKLAKQLGSDFIVGSRISLYEGIRGGCGTSAQDEVMEDFKDISEILAHFVTAGADFLNISAGIPTKTPLITRPLKNGEFYRFSQYRYTKTIKQIFPQTAVIGSTYTTGNQSCYDLALQNLTRGYTDFAGFGRQNLADPFFPLKTLNKSDEIKFCNLCGQCSKLLKENRHIFCKTHYPNNPYL